MKLSRVERLILANQYRILELLDHGDAKRHRQAQTAIAAGYELQIEQLADHLDMDGLSRDECAAVYDILSMFQDLRQSYEELEDKTSIRKEDVAFKGFDGNGEARYLGYCHFLRDDEHFEMELPKGKNLNTHQPMTGRYQQMYDVYKAINAQRHAAHRDYLSKEEIQKTVGISTHG